MDNFKKVDLTMSVDGIGAVQEYIRAPSKWNVVQKNINNYLENNHNSDMMVSPCWQIYNLHGIYDHLKYFDYLNTIRKIEVTPIILDFPMHYRIDILPYDIRQSAVDSIDKCFKLNIVKQPTLFRKLMTLKKILESPNSHKQSDLHMDQFVRVTKLYDKYRNQSIENSLPDLYKHVKKYF
jgi:glutamate-1-semialdehyde 2,1-aminomutase